jgi:hypothetical protein
MHNSTHSSSLYWTQISGEFHVPVALSSAKEFPLPTAIRIIKSLQARHHC